MLTLIGVALGMALPALKRGFDKIETRAAAQETLSAFFVGRASAIASGRPTDVMIDAPRQRVYVRTGSDTVLALDLGLRHGVGVASTRAYSTYNAAGLGYAAANLSVVLTRGSAAETVLVSREGRAKIGVRAR